MLRFGYITNGFQDHTLEQVIQVLRHFGYQGIGITLDHMHLDPFRVRPEELASIRRSLAEARLEPIVETGARYYLDPYRKHRPSLVSVDLEGRRRRLDYYRRGIDIAAALGAPVMTLFSGTPRPGTPPERSWSRLVRGLEPLLDLAEERGVRLGFEPEPGMFVATLGDFAELRRRVPHPALGLTLDLGHLVITESEPYAARVEEWREHVVNVHVDDVRDGRHEHLPLGQGEIDFPPLFRALEETDYGGLVLVELSRNSHEAPVQAQRSMLFLRGLDPR